MCACEQGALGARAGSATLRHAASSSHAEAPMSNDTRVPEVIKFVPAQLRHVGGAWGFEHYEAVVRLGDAPTIAAICAASAHATLAAQAANGQHLEEARILVDGGRLIVVVRFARPAGA